MTLELGPLLEGVVGRERDVRAMARAGTGVRWFSRPARGAFGFAGIHVRCSFPLLLRIVRRAPYSLRRDRDLRAARGQEEITKKTQPFVKAFTRSSTATRSTRATSPLRRDHALLRRDGRTGRGRKNADQLVSGDGGVRRSPRPPVRGELSSTAAMGIPAIRSTERGHKCTPFPPVAGGRRAAGSEG